MASRDRSPANFKFRRYFSGKKQHEEETIKSIGFGLTIGYQWVNSRGFVVEIFNGFGAMPPGLSRYRRMEPNGTPMTTLTNDYLKMDLRAGLSLG